MDIQDVQETISFNSYRAGAALRISPPILTLPNINYSLFAVSNLFGWAIVATSSDLNSTSSPSSFVLTRLDDLQATLDQAERHCISSFHPDQFQAFVIPIASFCSSPSLFITHVAFASWDRLVVVAVSDGSLHIFSLYSITNQNIKIPMKSIPSPDLVPLRMLVPNPSQGGPLSGFIAVVYQNGSIKLFDYYQIDKTSWSAQLATAAEWSPMGKRLLVGYTDGRLEFVSPEGAIKGKIDPPALVREQGLSVLHIKWLDQKNYIVNFIQPTDGPDTQSETFSLLVPRQTDPSACTFARATDCIISDGYSNLLPDILTITLPVNPQTNWKHLTLSSFTLSSTLTFMGCNTSDKTFSLILGEDGRPEIPAAEDDYSPALALGLGTSYCARLKLPLTWCFTTDGVLAVWKVEFIDSSSAPNALPVWNETLGYSDISTIDEKGIEAPPTAAASMPSSMDTPTSTLAKVSAQTCSFGAFGTPSTPFISSQVTAFGRPSLGVSSSSQSTAFGKPPVLNSSQSSSLAFGKSSLGPSPSPFASLLSGSTSGGFKSFASPSPLNQATPTSTLSASANSGFAAFSTSSGNAVSNTGLTVFSTPIGNAGSNGGFSALSNSSDQPRFGFASFANSSEKTGMTASVFDQITAVASQPSLGDGHDPTKKISIFDKPPGSEGPSPSKESLNPDISHKLSLDSSLVTSKSKNRHNASFQLSKGSSTFQSRAISDDEDDQGQANVRSIGSGPSSPSSTRENAPEAQPADPPSAGFDFSSLGLSMNPGTPGQLPKENQNSSVVADVKITQQQSRVSSPLSGPSLPSSAPDLIEQAQPNKLPSPGFDMSSLGLSIHHDSPVNPANEQPRVVTDDGGDQNTSELKPGVSDPTHSPAPGSTKVMELPMTPSTGLVITATRPSIGPKIPGDGDCEEPPQKALVGNHDNQQHPSGQYKSTSISFGFGGRTLPVPMRPSPFGSALPEVTASSDIRPSEQPSASSTPIPGGMTSQVSGITQPDSIAAVEVQPKLSVNVIDRLGESQITTFDSQKASSITSTLPHGWVSSTNATLVGSVDAQLDCPTSADIENVDIHSEIEADSSSGNDDYDSDNLDDRPSQSEEDVSPESENSESSDNEEELALSDNEEELALSDNETRSADVEAEREEHHDIQECTTPDQFGTGLSDDSMAIQNDSLQYKQDEVVHPPSNGTPKTGTETVSDEILASSTSPKSLFGLTSSPPSKLKRSVTSNRETPAEPPGAMTQGSVGFPATSRANSCGSSSQTSSKSHPPDSQSSTSSPQSITAQSPPHHTPQSITSQPAQTVVTSPKPPDTPTPSLPPPFLMTKPEFITPMTFLSAETVPKIYVNTGPETFSKPGEGIGEASSRIIDSITSEIECLKSVGSDCRRYLSECCKKLPQKRTNVTLEGPPNFLFGDLPDVYQRVQELKVLAKQKMMENEARLQAVTALDNAHIKADMKLEEIKRILRLRNDPGFFKAIRSRQLGPVQLAHQKDMRRLIRDVKHGISQMSQVLQSFESRQKEGSTQKNKIQPPSLDTINRCIRFITIGLTQHIINLEKLHLGFSQHKVLNSSLKDKKELPGATGLFPDSPSQTSDPAAALRALMSEHRGAILKDLILKRGDEPILTRAQTNLPKDASTEPSGLSHLRTSGIIVIQPRQNCQS